MKKGKPGAIQCLPLDYELLDSYSVKHKNSKDRHERNFALVIALGIRTGLRWSDLHRISPDQVRESSGKHFIVGTAKKTSKKFKRLIPDWLAKELLTSPKNDLVFHNLGKPYTAVWVNRRIKGAFKAQYLEAQKQDKTIGAHSVRKASALKLWHSSHDINKVREFLQHRDIVTTNNYLMIREAELDQAMEEAFL